jgi:hypothetical protein
LIQNDIKNITVSLKVKPRSYAKYNSGKLAPVGIKNNSIINAVGFVLTYNKSGAIIAIVIIYIKYKIIPIIKVQNDIVFNNKLVVDMSIILLSYF